MIGRQLAAATLLETMTYVDNPSNRRLGRVGKKYGTHVQHRDGSVTILSESAASPASSSGYGVSASSSTATSPPRKVYVDNASNQKLGRVGKETGTHVQHSDGSVTILSASSPSTSSYGVGTSSTTATSTPVCVGEPHVQHRNDSATISGAHSQSSSIEARHNPQLQSISKLISQQHHSEHRALSSETHFDDGITGKLHGSFSDPFQLTVPVQHYLQASKEEYGIASLTDLTKVQKHSKEVIPFSEIKIEEKRGKGEFGKVYAAVWKGTPIAFKKLIIQQISKKKQKRLEQEIKTFSMLEHPNIIKMFGVVLDPRSIGIVMECVPKTLFHALFIEVVSFSVAKKMELLGEVLSAIAYLHSKEITHCDIKCQNILLDCDNTARICDFGMSFLTKIASSATCRYSAPEVLCGELLSLDRLKMTDVYSLALIIYEVYVVEEVYEDLNYPQLVEHVGRNDLRPAQNPAIPKPVWELVTECWTKEASSRPLIDTLVIKWEEIRWNLS